MSFSVRIIHAINAEFVIRIHILLVSCVDNCAKIEVVELLLCDLVIYEKCIVSSYIQHNLCKKRIARASSSQKCYLQIYSNDNIEFG